jgi:hypothetical protein
MSVKRCPLCHVASEPTAWRCSCGYEFGQSADQVVALLRDQRTNTSIVLGLLVVLDAAAVGWLVYTALYGGHLIFSVTAIIGLGVWTARMARKLEITRESLRQIAAQHEPPRAIVHKHKTRP